ncbi:glycogen/starch synthase [Rubrivirga litoralis]|uniref:starch synthase n=1 Tax=Rubrivirga litoralis TaxID=3075598 RepID=A0ABU3BQQ0_9BACT|nr:glycogen/starch synthase [Rubrivirga sp. F394]MDT0631619.1 glycogen/starch synthase [Rubrivirga sp. F394]
MRVLFVSGEVAPFSDTTETARLMRVLPEALEEHKDVEPRIVMPRYGVISERKNRLHEVIRLSGAEIAAGDTTDTLKVKVASIPGIRLQVYFMDSVAFFKRKGVWRDRKTEAVFEDNPARALFFARAALSTAQKLGWGPDVVHAAGWISAFIPHVLQTDLADDELFASTRSVFTPGAVEGFEPTLSEDEAGALGLPEAWAGRTLRSIGLETADAVAYADGDEPGEGEPAGPTLPSEGVPAADAAAEVYGSLSPAQAA